MKIKTMFIPLIILIIVFGGIMTSDVLGYWKTQSSKIPAKYKQSELSSQYDPNDIRGSYAFSDIVKYFNIPLQDLLEAFDIDDNDNGANFKCKEIKNKYNELNNDQDIEIGTASIKYFVALYTGLPFDITEEIYLPVSAVNILKEKVQLTNEQLKYLENHTIHFAK